MREITKRLTRNLVFYTFTKSYDRTDPNWASGDGNERDLGWLELSDWISSRGDGPSFTLVQASHATLKLLQIVYGVCGISDKKTSVSLREEREKSSRMHR